ncbi:nucleotidyltransferase family protein [Marinoscillum furvescens]|uniref:CBS domain protein n=1 Tax=Marinoscillum furvescens DSM 4134 TaxID=1122208 RepID=A0A3D9L638_MARFU|nr:nucleotidyltransferase family protein [Marinoscillum furvescens]REE01638.1 CBS domain protein [Marinoscillum furvescens DSM 4134]
MRNFKDHLIKSGTSIKEALKQLNDLASDAILFVVDENDKLKGSLTDGDVRRGLLEDISIDHKVDDIIQENPHFVVKGNFSINDIIELRDKKITIIPILNKNHVPVNVINLRHIRSYLPVDVVIMAGGKGSRLKPLTDTTPKPLLKVGDKPIIQHNVDRMALYGVDDFWITVNYLGDQLIDFFEKRDDDNINIGFVKEPEALGTIGSLSLVKEFHHDYLILTNSDILTNLDYEHFFMEFISSGADLSMVTIPYRVNIPYAVIETSNDGSIQNFKEKPTYTYFSNGGIYLMKRSVVDLIPKGKFYNATDLVEDMIIRGMKVTSYPLRGYWLDVGKHEDFQKAQEDIKHIKF